MHKICRGATSVCREDNGNGAEAVRVFTVLLRGLEARNFLVLCAQSAVFRHRLTAAAAVSVHLQTRSGRHGRHSNTFKASARLLRLSYVLSAVCREYSETPTESSEGFLLPCRRLIQIPLAGDIAHYYAETAKSPADFDCLLNVLLSADSKSPMRRSDSLYLSCSVTSRWLHQFSSDH